MAYFNEADVKFRINLDCNENGTRYTLTVYQLEDYYYVRLPNRTTIQLTYEFRRVPRWRQHFGKLSQGTVELIGQAIESYKS